nr:probable methyltransferase PMT23 [Tanacetum cinerariifolium]
MAYTLASKAQDKTFKSFSSTDAELIFDDDTRCWPELVTNVYIGGLAVNWSSVRNVIDMNDGYG